METNPKPNALPVVNNTTILPKVIAGCLAGCGILILLFIILGVAAFKTGSKSFSEADVVARQFLQAVKDNQPDAAYALTSPGFREYASVAVFKDYMTKWRNLTGDYGGINLTGERWMGGTSGKRVTLVYTIQTSKNTVQVTMVLISQNSPYRVLACDFTEHPLHK